MKHIHNIYRKVGELKVQVEHVSRDLEELESIIEAFAPEVKHSPASQLIKRERAIFDQEQETFPAKRGRR